MPEARDLLEKWRNGGGVPAYMTENLRRIGRENGIKDSPQMTPNQLLDELEGIDAADHREPRERTEWPERHERPESTLGVDE